MRRKISLLLVFLALACSSVFAFQFEPLVQTFDVSGPNATKTFTITNDSDDIIAVVVSALVRTQDAQGNEVNSDASRYFNIQPARILIQPQSSQIVRVQYRGPRTVTSELSFRIVAEQIPYSQGRIASAGSMFNFLYVFRASAYVLPTQIQESVQITGLADNGDGTLAVTLSNMGNVHQILYDCTLTLQDESGNTIALSGSEQLPGISGANILAGTTWTKNIPFPEGLDSGSTYRASLTYSFDISNQ
ncbi:MAG: molecular chaperone [Spirochaetes bacterium]|uniref:Molecular chaperone n=1 Tax=Candidatus Aphodenecus pullistercoris TaxID=2840669 RepID=A0A9D9EAU7_9SPIR|nr:molecular chaperone [Candidatus Aphodenecus pullistercoris]